jgi:hypothetical protein
MQVIFITMARSDDDVATLARRCKALHIRGKEVCKWAQHLCQVGAAPVIVSKPW